MKKHIFAALVLSLSACGGGGGGGDDSDFSFLGGVYQGATARVLNDCGVDVPAVFNVDFNVNQDGNKIVIDSPTGATYEGIVTGPDSLRATKETVSSSGCPTTSVIDISNIDGDSGDVIVAITATCGRVTCNLGYQGLGVSRRLS